MQTRIDRQAFVDVYLTIRTREARGTLTRVAEKCVLTCTAVLTWVGKTPKAYKQENERASKKDE
jgi:hypothetical protein